MLFIVSKFMVSLINSLIMGAKLLNNNINYILMMPVIIKAQFCIDFPKVHYKLLYAVENIQI